MLQSMGSQRVGHDLATEQQIIFNHIQMTGRFQSKEENEQ